MVCRMFRIQQSSSSSKLSGASTLWLSGPGKGDLLSSSPLAAECEAPKLQHWAMVQAAQKQLCVLGVKQAEVRAAMGWLM